MHNHSLTFTTPLICHIYNSPHPSVLVDAGSRYEVNYTSGVSHMLQRMAFNGTAKYPSRDVILSTLDPIGGMFNCQHFRDIIIYSVTSLSYSVPQAMEVLADALWRPSLSQEEVSTF